MSLSTSTMLVIGLLMLVAGIIFLFAPGALMTFISVAVSLLLIMGGVGILAGGISLPTM